MPQQRISILMDFPQPVEALFAFAARHENIALILGGARVERLRDGEGHPDGVGSVRRIHLFPSPAFEETITAFEPNARIEYRITRGGLLRNHHGVMRFTPTGTGTRLDYTITFDPRIPLTGGLIRKVTEDSLRKGLARVAAMGPLKT